MLAYFKTGELAEYVEEWAKLYDYKESCRILELPKHERKGELAKLPDGRRKRVEQCCIDLHRRRQVITEFQKSLI